MFHHLPAEEKEATLHAVRRALKPGASFHMLDFGGPESGHGFLSHFIHSHEQLKGNSEDHVIEMMKRAGFADATAVGHCSMIFGRGVYYSGSR